MECPVCKKEFNEHTGRRPKKFCSDECKVKFWNAKKKVALNNKPENKKRIEEERNTPIDTTNFKQPVFANDIERQLWEFEQQQLKTKK